MPHRSTIHHYHETTGIRLSATTPPSMVLVDNSGGVDGSPGARIQFSEPETFRVEARPHDSGARPIPINYSPEMDD